MTKRTHLLEAASAVLLLALAILLLPHGPIFHPVHASSVTIHLVGYSPSGWNGTNPTIPVQPGESVTVDLSSGDGAPHQFLVDLDGDGISDVSNCPPNSSPTDDPCSMQFSGTGTTSVTFTANSVGSFKYYCTIHYPYMVGTFMVQAPQAPGFSIMSSPASIGVIQGSTSNTTTISLNSLNGFSGRINLTATASQQGLINSFNPTFVTLSSGGSGTSTLTVSTSTTPPGFYAVTVHGTGVSATNTTTVGVSVTIPDFSINPSLPNLSVAQGSAATATITLTSLSGFKSTLTLTGTVSPSGPTVSFSPTSVTLSSGGSVTSIMTVSASGGTYRVATGSYAVTVKVTNGTLTHSTTMSLQVGASPPSNLPLTLLIGASAAILAAAGIAIYLVRRRTGGNKQPPLPASNNP